MTDGLSKSHLRVFLSVDLVGSTQLKAKINHHETYKKYSSRLRVLSSVIDDAKDCSLSEEEIDLAVIESLGISVDDLDWAEVVSNFYKNFHSAFLAELVGMRTSPHDMSWLDTGMAPWKAIGDELVYEREVSSRSELYEIVISFLKALRSTDKSFERQGPSLRIKGSAWVAGFPVRNRVIHLPAIDRQDYLGPDIDIGFRLGKHTEPGMLVVSMELAELLSEVPMLMEVKGKIVGWESLKGVWNNRLYPIIWIDLPDRLNEDDYSALPFELWHCEESSLCKLWSDGEECKPLHAIRDTLEKIRKQLPESYGVVKPYIPSDDDFKDAISEKHQGILDLLKKIEAHQSKVDQQEALSDVGESDVDMDVAREKLKEIFPKKRK